MKPTLKLLLALAMLAAAAGAGYFAGQNKQPVQHPTATAAAERKPLYYRNPMGLADTSPVPKKDGMGMDYIAVYADEAGATAKGSVHIDAAKVQKLGVRTEAAALRPLSQAIRATGRIEADERAIHVVAPRFEGWVEKLHVSASGQPVARGQVLFEVYSPELVSAQREYAAAAQGAASASDPDTRTAMHQLAQASLQRLRNWEISAEQVKALAAGGAPQRTLGVRSPGSGIVTEKRAVQGMRFAAGETLFTVADLSRVWVLVDIAEQDMGRVKAGTAAQVRVTAYPGEVLKGMVAYVYPSLNGETRTATARIELANPAGRLKPAMYAQVELALPGQAATLSVPLSAVIDSGKRQQVIIAVATADGMRFSPREVKLGSRDDQHVEIVDGLREGDIVVTAANFLIDAESNLKAAFAGMGNANAANGGAPAAEAAAAAVGHSATGTVVAIDAKGGTVNISHDAVASLHWPAMTMDFAVANSGLLKNVKPGMKVDFELVERKPDDWVITRIEAR